MELRGITKAQMLEKFKTASLNGNLQKADDVPKCLDPLSGKIITVEEFNSKYDNGNTLLQVQIPGGNSMNYDC